MNSIKSIVMDVDGTLYNSKKVITPKTKEALLAAQTSGIKLVIASGRPTAGLITIGKELQMKDHRGLFIAYNGSKAIDAATNEILFNQPLSIADGKAVLEHLKNFDVYPMIDKDNYMYVNNVYAAPIHHRGAEMNVIEYETRSNNYLLCEQADLADFLDFELNKILTAGEPEYLEKHYKEMMKPFKDSLSCMFTADFYFEYTAHSIDKAKALATVLEPMGFSRDDIICFGDGMNDIAMLNYAGIGVAMGNAVEDLKKAADYVTADNDDDGIAKALEKYLR